MKRNECVREEKQSLLNVTGVATKFLVPNMAIVSMDIDSYSSNQTPVQVQLANDKKVERVVNNLNKIGVKKEDITTVRDIIKPIYNENGTIDKYKASTTIKVNFYDLTTVSQFIYDYQGSDISIFQVIMTIEDFQGEYRKTLDMAMENAKMNAENLANSQNLTLSNEPKNISETTDLPVLLDNVIIEAYDGSDVNFSIITVTATVRVSYSIL